MAKNDGRLRAALVFLLLVSAALFAVGTTVERHHHNESGSSSETASHTETSGETGSGTGDESGANAEQGNSGTSASAEASSSEDLFGVDTEAPWVVALGVVVSALLALAVWMTERRFVLVLVVGLGVLLAVLDIRELAHQVSESRTSLVILSAVLAVLHLAVAAVAGMLLAQRRPQPAVA